jgi:hypothetical protein
MTIREQMVKMMERSDSSAKQIESLHATNEKNSGVDRMLEERLRTLEIDAAHKRR